MSWFQSSSSFASLAKNALKEAQKTIDKALDIKDDNVGVGGDGKGINAAVSSVADAATEFFSSWSTFSGTSTTSDSSNADESDTTLVPSEQTQPPLPVVTTVPPKGTSGTALLSLTPVAVKSIVESTTADDGDLVPIQPKRVEEVGDGTRIVVTTAEDGTQPAKKSSSDELQTQPHVMDASDSFESSVDTSSTSTTIEVVEDSHATKSTKSVVDESSLSEPVLENTSEESTCSIVNNDEPLLIVSQPSPQTNEVHPAEDEEPALPLNSDTVPDPDAGQGQDDDSSSTLVVVEGLNSTMLLSEPEVSHPVQAELESEKGESITVSPSLPEPLDFPSTETLEFESEAEPSSSKLSVSSRATSSISVISEEKDTTSSSPQISPASQDNLSSSSVESPSFEIVSMHQVHQIPHMSTLEFLTSSHHHPSSIVHSLQSTPDRGTPLTHSRSNSNTSSSFDRVEDPNTRPSKYTGHNFISSTSSSDIEVIPLPLHSNENLHLLYPKRKSVIDIETQTTDTWTDMAEVKEKVVEMIPAKTSALLAEKDFEITQLREEGEKLSKKQFELSTAIKKLRQKEKDTDTTVKSLKSDLVTKNVEIERITKTLLARESQELVHNETISKLNSENRKLLNTINQLRSDLEDSTHHASSMKASLEEASLEILQLQNAVSSVQRDTAEVDQLTKLHGESKNRAESLQKEVELLRESINSIQTRNTSRENELKTQIHSLTQHVHRLENQLADNSFEVADATMPLSLEIEKLQQELRTSTQSFSRRESTFLTKLSELEDKLSVQLEIEKELKSNEMKLQKSIASLQEQNNRLQEENVLLSSRIATENSLQSKYSKLESESSSLQQELNLLTTEMSTLKSQNENLSTELTTVRNNLQAETKRNQQLSEQLLRSNQNNPYVDRTSTSSAQLQQDRGSSNNSPRSVTSEALGLDDVILDSGWQNPSLTPKSYFDSFPSVNYIENLQGHLKQKELELLQLQHEVSQTEKIRKSLNDEIAQLTVTNQELVQRLEKQEQLEQRLEELDQNYNAILQMYGEKVEETEELRMDLDDVKEMYKVQIEQLLKKAS